MSGGGDTPIKTLFKYNNGDTTFSFGEIIQRSGENFVNARLYGKDSTHYYSASSSGNCIGDNAQINDRQKEIIAEACLHTLGLEAKSVNITVKEITVGEPIEDWDKYQLITRS